MWGGCLDAARARFDNRPVSHRIVPFVLCWAAVGLISTWSPAWHPPRPRRSRHGRGRAPRGPGGRGAPARPWTARPCPWRRPPAPAPSPWAPIRRLTRLDDVRAHPRGARPSARDAHGRRGAARDLRRTRRRTVSVLQTPDLGRVSLLLEVVSTVVAVPADAGACFEPEHGYPARRTTSLYARSGDAVAGHRARRRTTRASRSRRRYAGARARSRGTTCWSSTSRTIRRLPHRPAHRDRDGRGLAPDGGRRDRPPADGALRSALRSSPETRVTVPWRAIRVVRPSGGAFVYASRLPFESELVWYYRDDEREHGYLERWFPARVDRRPSGCPLRLAGRTYRHGFAVHSRSIVTVPRKGLETLRDALRRRRRGARGDRGRRRGRTRARGREGALGGQDVRAGEAPRRIGPLDVAGRRGRSCSRSTSARRCTSGTTRPGPTRSCSVERRADLRPPRRPAADPAAAPRRWCSSSGRVHATPRRRLARGSGPRVSCCRLLVAAFAGPQRPAWRERTRRLVVAVDRSFALDVHGRREALELAARGGRGARGQGAAVTLLGFAERAAAAWTLGDAWPRGPVGPWPEPPAAMAGSPVAEPPTGAAARARRRPSPRRSSPSPRTSAGTVLLLTSGRGSTAGLAAAARHLEETGIRLRAAALPSDVPPPPPRSAVVALDLPAHGARRVRRDGARARSRRPARWSCSSTDSRWAGRARHRRARARAR